MKRTVLALLFALLSMATASVPAEDSFSAGSGPSAASPAGHPSSVKITRAVSTDGDPRNPPAPSTNPNLLDSVSLPNGLTKIVQAVPSLAIDDVLLSEGNAGTTTFTFTVSLSAPAPAGGVTFDIATADGTATAPGDYIARALTGQTIPAGSTTYSFDVLVIGDTIYEANEVFFVNVTNVTNATVGDGQGVGTIVNDDAAAADLSVTKVGTPNPVIAGNNLTYTVTVSNAGPGVAASTSLSDTLPAGTSFVSLAAPGGWNCTTPAVGAPGTVTCSDAAMAIGSPATFTLVAAVASSMAAGTVISNTATVASAITDPDAGNNSATATASVVNPRIDIDGNNDYDAPTDGLMIIRYLFGLTGTALTGGATGPGATRSTPAEIMDYLDGMRPRLDVDGDGQADALTDGLLLFRYLSGLRGTSLVSGATAAGATRTAAAEVESYIQSLLPVYPYVVSAVSTGSTSVQVTFSQPVAHSGPGAGNSATNPANYTLTDPTGTCNTAPSPTTLDTGAAIAADPTFTVFTLATTAQKPCTFVITVANVVSLAEGASLTSPLSATFAGNEAFRVTSAACVDTTHVQVNFNRPFAAAGPHSALLATHYALPAALGAAGPPGPAAGLVYPIAVAAIPGNAGVILQHGAPQANAIYTVIAANADASDGFAEAESIQSSGIPAPVQDLQSSPNDRAMFAGCGTGGAAFSDGPLFFDPLGDGSDFASLVSFNNRIYVGPNRWGNTAARFEYDGTNPGVMTFGIIKDTNAAGGGVHLNTATGPFSSFGHAGCTANVMTPAVGLAGACGPDNEDGRSLFNVGTLGGQQMLFAGGSRSAGDFDYAYFTADADNQLDFRYLDLGATTGANTQALSSLATLNDRLYLGFSRQPNSSPDFSKTSFNPADTSYCSTNASCDVTTQGVRLEIQFMNYLGRLAPAATANYAYYANVDSILPFNNVLYAAGGGHPQVNHDGGIIRSTGVNAGNPGPCLSAGSCNDWVDIAPRTLTLPYEPPTSTAPWYYDTDGGTWFSLEMMKLRDFNPGDKAFPQWAVYKGNLYLARNVCKTPASGAIADAAPPTGSHPGYAECFASDANRRAQLWKCVPGGNNVCDDQSEWQLVDGGDRVTNFGHAGNRTISMVVANGNYLYVGFDNAGGVEVWRTAHANPASDDANSGWEQVSLPTPYTSPPLSAASVVTNIWSAISVQVGMTSYLYLAAGTPGWPLAVFRQGND